jgi:hypothetical protein
VSGAAPLRLCVVENEAGAVSVDHALLAPATGAPPDVRVIKECHARDRAQDQ